MEKINICIINQFGYILYNKNCERKAIGGTEVQLYMLSKQLIQNPKMDVSVLTGKSKMKMKKYEVINNLKIYQVLPISYLPIETTFVAILKIINFFIILRKINPDIIIQRSSGLTTFLCALYCTIYHKKLVYSIASTVDVNGSASKGIFGKLYMWGITQASYIIAQSTEQIKMLENWRNQKFDNISVIKNGYFIKKSNIEEKNTILWVGRAIGYKRPEIFLKLPEIFPNQQFIMICNEGKDIEYWKEIKQEAEKIVNLKFISFVLFEKIDQYFKDSRVFINTSDFEGFPNTFLQAAKNKTPILSLNVNPDNFITKFKCGFVCGNSFEKLVNNLEILLTNKDFYKKCSKNVLKYVKAYHDINKISKKWINILIELHNFS